ncbi:MAG: hypothetical protein F6K28_53100 [Microcoleus sp. SIO2G3]|nr:hypothetical protein [Microcoleus sp. SIO2G3]
MPRDSESLIDIERASRRILRDASGCDRTELETNNERQSPLFKGDARGIFTDINEANKV